MMVTVLHSECCSHKIETIKRDQPSLLHFSKGNGIRCGLGGRLARGPVPRMDAACQGTCGAWRLLAGGQLPASCDWLETSPRERSREVYVQRIITGLSGSAGSLQALRYATELARHHDAALIPVLAWVPPAGQMPDRRFPSPDLRDVWT